jgi:hypothetical protein
MPGRDRPKLNPGRTRVPGVRVVRTYQRAWLRADLVAGAVLAAESITAYAARSVHSAL